MPADLCYQRTYLNHCPTSAVVGVQRLILNLRRGSVSYAPLPILWDLLRFGGGCVIFLFGGVWGNMYQMKWLRWSCVQGRFDKNELANGDLVVLASILGIDGQKARQQGYVIPVMISGLFSFFLSFFLSVASQPSLALTDPLQRAAPTILFCQKKEICQQRQGKRMLTLILILQLLVWCVFFLLPLSQASGSQCFRPNGMSAGNDQPCEPSHSESF